MGYRIDYSVPWLLVEIVVVLESFLNLAAHLRTATYVQGVLVVELRYTLRYYMENGFLIDLIGALPWNLILSILFVA